MAKFVRPKNLEFPKVYHTFKAKDKDSDVLVSYRVQDLPEEYFEKALELLEKYQLPEETLAASKKLVESEEAKEICKAFIGAIFLEKLSLACFKDGSDELVAVNVMVVDVQGHDEEINFANKEIMEILELMDYCKANFNVYDNYKVDKYLTAYGLCVNPNYRRRGIAIEMLRSRKPYLKDLGLTVTSTAFTGLGSQTAATRAGFTTNYVTTYDDLEIVFPHFNFKPLNVEFLKMMSLKID